MEKTELFYVPLTDKTAYIPIETHIQEYCSPFHGKLHDLVSQKIIEEKYKVENLIFSINLFEPSVNSDFTDLLQKSLDYCNSTQFFPNLKNVYVLYDSAIINHLINPYNLSKINVDYLLLRSGLTEKISDTYELKNYTGGNGKALFLMGETTRINRFPVLYQFYKNNNINLLEYSFDYNYKRNYQNFTEFLRQIPNWFLSSLYDSTQLNDESFEKVCLELENKLPNDLFLSGPYFQTFDTCAYYFTSQWQDTSVAYVPETYFMPIGFYKNRIKHRLTEKTWKPISYKKPFISCTLTDWDSIYLKELGFKTFVEYTDAPDLVTFSDFPNNLDFYSKLAHTRIVSFLKNLNQNLTAIQDNIEHNYELWKNLSNQELSNLYNHCPCLLELSDVNVAKIFIMGQFNRYLLDYRPDIVSESN